MVVLFCPKCRNLDHNNLTPSLSLLMSFRPGDCRALTWPEVLAQYILVVTQYVLTSILYLNIHVYLNCVL